MSKNVTRVLIVLVSTMLVLAACGPAPVAEDPALAEAQAQIAALQDQLEEAAAGGDVSEEDLAALEAQLADAQAEAEAAAAAAAEAEAAAAVGPELAISLDEFTDATSTGRALLRPPVMKKAALACTWQLSSTRSPTP
jgi:septal ring factor EnvC (AmiA/AmiB activator)